MKQKQVRMSQLTILGLALGMAACVPDEIPGVRTESSLVIESRYVEPLPESMIGQPLETIVSTLETGQGATPSATQNRIEDRPASSIVRERVLTFTTTEQDGKLGMTLVSARASNSLAYVPGGAGGGGDLDTGDHWTCNYVANNPFGPPPFNPGGVNFGDMHVSGIPQQCVDAGYCPVFDDCFGDGGNGPGGGPGGSGNGPGGSGGGPGGSGDDDNSSPVTPEEVCPPKDYSSCVTCCMKNGEGILPQREYCFDTMQGAMYTNCVNRCNKTVQEYQWDSLKYEACPERVPELKGDTTPPNP